MENQPENWTDESCEELREAVFEALFDPHTFDGRKFPDPVEPWEEWAVQSADKNMTGDRVVVILTHEDHKAVFTAIKVNDLWDSQIAIYKMEGAA